MTYTYKRNASPPTCLLIAASLASLCLADTSWARIEVKDKVVLANVSRYPMHYRAGKTRKQVASKKATVLSPRNYPITIEYFNGLKRRPGWEKLTIGSAGVYTFRFDRGRWMATKAQSKRQTRRDPSSTVRRRSAGSRSRVVRSGAAYRRVRRYGPRYPVLARVGRDVMCLYRFVRDEEDRDLLRRLILEESIDDAARDEILNRLDSLAVNLPADERAEFKRSLENLDNLNPQDLKQLEAATNEDWKQVEDGLHDSVDQELWNNVVTDFEDVGLDDLPAAETADLSDVGINDVEEDVDLGDLDGEVGLDIAEDVDLGDIGAGVEDVDLGDLDVGHDIDFGGGGFDAGSLDVGGDFGGFDDAGGDVGFGGGDVGGGFDDVGGGFDDFGGGFDFDF